MAMFTLHAKTKAKVINRRGMTTSFFGEVSFCASGGPSQRMFNSPLPLT
jgi:hypothetical protein